MSLTNMLWTTKEIEEYVQNRSPSLRMLYASRKLPANDPMERARYLSEVFLNLTMTDHDLIMRTAAKKGRTAALEILETMAVTELRKNY